ncbi:MAG: nucleotide exchange factor GrpE [Bacteroidales bacterium]|nr:nucleotide exchange factor GrpE [Bacteroidales bacterium]MDY6348297.1 nucleotide exchange factor GrpE [Bacteroidales bacterium]
MKEQEEDLIQNENVPEEDKQDNLEQKSDNLTDKEDNSDKKNGLFSKKKNKEAARIKELEAEIEGLKAEKAELNDRFLRLFSEFDNYKKRVSKEKLDLISTASEKVIVSVLPVVDDFERAITANEKVEDINSVKEGFELIYNKLIQTLKHFDVEEIKAKGEVFNTDFHEAVTHFPAQNEEEKGKVIDVTQKGYKLKDKVIRYAKVVVGQ